jgi:electron transport complex protein RnfB
MSFSILSALIVMGSLGLLFGVGLALASRVFAVTRDPRVEQIEEVLPGANCGACGAPGCSGFAEGVVEGKYPVNGCTVGGADVAVLVAQIMGTEVGEVVPKVAVVRCRGDREACIERARYHGIEDCRAAVLIDEGAKGCVYGCLGMGTCVEACPFGAMRMGEKGLPIVDEDLCTGCGECVRVCPRNIMELIPRNQYVFVACVSKDFGKAVKSICKVGCIGCGLCANPKTTADEIITMDGKLPVIHYDKVKDAWKDLENAVAKCPTKSFGVRGKEVPVPEEAIKEEEPA